MSRYALGGAAFFKKETKAKRGKGMKLFGSSGSGEHSGSGERSTPEIRTQEIRSAPPEQPAKPASPPQKPKKKKNTLRRLCTVFGVIILVVAAALIGYSIWEKPPTIVTPPPAASTTPTPTHAPDATPAPDDPDTTPAPEPAVDPDAPSVAFSSDRRDGIYTILLVGRDHASNSTDTIIVASFDTVNHTVSCVNIPRDTLINIGWSSTPKKINAVYPGYVNSGRDGVEGLRAQVKNLLGFDVDCYAVVSLKAVEETVDAIGGVWFDVPTDMDYDDPTQDLHIHIKAGNQLLNGEDALKVCRFRASYGGGDIERIGVQQAFLMATAKQLLTVGNIPNLANVIDVVLRNVDTDLTSANLAFFARQFLLCSSEDVTFHTLPIGMGCYINGISFVSVNVDEWLDMVNTYLNPYTDAVTRQNVNILVSNNQSGTSMEATNGAIAGGPDSFCCLTCTVANGGQATHHLPGTCPNAG